jgi:hypothetical protein
MKYQGFSEENPMNNEDKKEVEKIIKDFIEGKLVPDPVEAKPYRTSLSKQVAVSRERLLFGATEDEGYLMRIGNTIVSSIIYPVGAVYLTKSVDDPVDILGFGTWSDIGPIAGINVWERTG